MSESTPKFNPESISLDKNPEKTGSMTDAQKSATKLANRLGLEIQKALPQIRELYLQGLSLSELVEQFDIKSKFGVPNEKTARAAVLNALKGFKNKSNLEGFEDYLGLIPDPKTWEETSKKHQIRGSQKVGQLMKEEGRGFFSMTQEERSQVGLKSGNYLYENSLGIHSQSPEEKRKLGEMVRNKGLGLFSLNEEQLTAARIAGAKSQMENKIGIHSQTPEEKKELGNKAAITRGQIPFSDQETELIKNLALLPDYQRGKLKDIAKITAEVNKQIHNGKSVRTNKTIISKLNNIKVRTKD